MIQQEQQQIIQKPQQSSYFCSFSNLDCTQMSQQSQNLKYSPYLNQYKQYFDPVQQQSDNHIKQILNNSHQIYKNKVSINEEYLKKKILKNYFIKPLIQINSIQHHAVVVNYFVYINKFRFDINMLNLDGQASQLNLIGFGGYGEINLIKLSQQISLVCKRIKFDQEINIIKQNRKNGWKINPNKIEIETVIQQFAFYRLCSLFKIGPKIYDKFGFDLVCYSDSIQFYMEQCKLAFNQKIQHDIKLALRVLHKLQIIHKDVKPQNIMYSTAYGRFVLLDFGISQQINERLGELTITYKEGTLNYMCLQMRQIKNKPRLIDVYYNDIYGLIKSIEKLNQHKSKYLLRQLYKLDKSTKNNSNNTDFYKGLHIIGCIINYNQEKFEKYFNLYNTCLKAQSLKKLCQHFDLSQIKKVILMNPFNNKSLIYLVESFLYPKNNMFTRTQIEFLIRIYGISKVLLSFADEFQPFQQLNQFINILRNIQNDKQDNQFKIWNQYSQTQLIKSLEKQSIYFYEKILSNENEKDIIQFCQITLDLLLRAKNIIKLNLKQLLIKIIDQQKTSKFLLFNLLFQICDQSNPGINLFNNYVDLCTLKTQKNVRNLIYKKLVNFYRQVGDFAYLSKYDSLIQEQQYNEVVSDINDLNEEIFILEAKNLYKIGMYYKTKGKIIEAFNCFHKSIQYYILNPLTIEFLEVLTEIANNYKIIRKFDKYQSYCLKALQIHKQQKQSDMLLKIMWNIAQCRYLKGKNQEANYFLQQSLKIALKIYRSDHCIIADYYSSLGYFCYINSDFKQSFQFCKRSINILVDFKLQQSYTYVNALQMIGCIYNHQRKLAQAIDIFSQCLKIKINMYGDYHSEIAKTLNNLITQYMQIEQYQKALIQAKRVIKICQIIKLNDYRVVRAYDLIALAYFSLGNMNNMLSITKKSIQFVITYFGEGFKYLNYSYSNFGKYYAYIKDYKQAIYWYQQSIQIKQRQYGLWHFDLLAILHELSECYYQVGEYNNCIRYLQKAMKLINMNENKTYDKYFSLSLLLADSYFKFEKYYECQLLLKRLIKKYLTANKNNLYEIILRLGNCLFNIQKFKDVLYYYTKYFNLINSQNHYQQKQFCILKCIQCEIFLCKPQDRKRKAKSIQTISKTNFNYFESFNCDIRILFKYIFQSILRPDQSIFRLLCLCNKSKNISINQLYQMFLDEFSYNFKGIWTIIKKLCQNKPLRMKNKNDLQLISIYKKYLKWNRQIKLNQGFQKHIKKRINVLLKTI